MCGIAGILDPARTHPALLREMADAMAHRGPDAEGIEQVGAMGMVHRRLSILDLDARGDQPMRSHNGRYTMVFNGEIYNFKDLKARLPGVEYRTETDSEVLLEAFAKVGVECFSWLNGMFALAIWDQEKQELTLARDRLGIKPLYIHQDGRHLEFASEMRALLQLPWIPKKIYDKSLANYLSYQTVYNDQSMVERIWMLPPGSYMQVRVAGDRLASDEVVDYWEFKTEPQPLQSPGEVKRKIFDLLAASVERRLMSDVPLGAFLSGGIDSSAIVALMREVSDQPIDTFSVVFQDKAYDESPYSEMIAQKYETRHHPILLKPEDFLEALPEALKGMDHPSGDGINSYVVAKVTREKGIKVALSGLGGDELFAGYPIFSQIPRILNSTVMRQPFFLRRPLAKVYRLLKKGREAEKKASLLDLLSVRFESVYPIYRTIYDWPQACRLAGVSDALSPAGLRSFQATRQSDQLLSQISIAEITSYTQDVLLRDMDQMSMAHALEARVPFFDHELVEYVIGLPDAIKKPHFPKALLVESLGDRLPHDLVHRKKMGFVFPWEDWLRGPLKGYAEVRWQAMQDRGLLDPDFMGQVWTDFQQAKGPWLWTHIWLPVVLEEWMQNNGFA